MKTLAIISILLIILAGAAFVGKTSFVDGITIERPFTALAFIAVCILGWLEK